MSEKSFSYKMIPEQMRSILEKDDFYSDIVREAFSDKYCEILRKTPYFFPEYTDHGVDHISDVLEIMYLLIKEETMEKLSPEEIAICVLAALYHDVAMFIGPAMFFELVNNDYKEKWEKYINDMMKCPYSEICKIVGADSDKIDYACLNKIIVENNSELLTDIKFKLIIGNFIRIYHSELAEYYINRCNMIPFFKDIKMPFACDEESGIYIELKELVGFVSKSHGMYLRDGVIKELIEKKQGNPDIKIGFLYGCRILYPIILLRLADYLDINDRRAPSIVRDNFIIFSSISKKEYDWNSEIQMKGKSYKDFFDLDTREINIENNSVKSPRNYAELMKWNKGVQTEIDECTSVLYHYYSKENALRLSVSRIKYTVRDIEKLSFAPMPAKSKADSSVFPLLSRSIYHDDFKAGMRELLQNAIDSCRERKSLENEQYKPVIQIIYDRVTQKLSIIDNGIGMTEEIIRNFFLTAGSSYFGTSEWDKLFSNNKSASPLHVGCFGIGVFSYFLLTEKFDVVTRYYTNKTGWSFSISNDDILENNEITLKKSYNAMRGTEVSMIIDEKLVNCISDKNVWAGLIDLDDIEVFFKMDEETKINRKSDMPWFIINNSKGVVIKGAFDLGESNGCSSINSIVVNDRVDSCYINIKTDKPKAFISVARDKFSESVKVLYKKWCEDITHYFVYNIDEFIRYLKYIEFGKESYWINLNYRRITIFIEEIVQQVDDPIVENDESMERNYLNVFNQKDVSIIREELDRITYNVYDDIKDYDKKLEKLTFFFSLIPIERNSGTFIIQDKLKIKKIKIGKKIFEIKSIFIPTKLNYYTENLGPSKKYKYISFDEVKYFNRSESIYYKKAYPLVDTEKILDNLFRIFASYENIRQAEEKSLSMGKT